MSFAVLGLPAQKCTIVGSIALGRLLIGLDLLPQIGLEIVWFILWRLQLFASRAQEQVLLLQVWANSFA